MSRRPPHLCACSAYIIPHGELCQCQAKARRERNARHDAHRPTASARGYTSQWRRDRLAFLRTHPACALCAQPATVVDHVIPHRGDSALFDNTANWQALCAPCHNSVKQRLERRPRR